MRAVVGDLGDAKATKRVAEEIMRIQSARRMGMELFAATRRVKKSIRTSVVYIYHHLRQLHRSSLFFLVSIVFLYNFLYYKISPNFPFDHYLKYLKETQIIRETLH